MRLAFSILFASCLVAVSAPAPLQHNPWTTTTNDPTVTLQAQQPVSITTTNQIALEAQGLISWTNLVNGHINVRSAPFYAKGDGVTDDTAAIKAAYNLISKSGGTLFFPYTGNAYVCNILITNSNISLISTINNASATNQIVLRPFDLTKPTVQVGNDGNLVYGFCARNISIAGCAASGAVGAGALHLLGGSVECSVVNCGFVGGTNVVKLSAGMTYPCTLNRFTHCSIWVNAHGDGETALYVFRPLVGSYTTGIHFNNGHINGSVIADNGQALNMANVYCDFMPPEGVIIRNGAEIRSDNVSYDNQASTNLFTIDWSGTTNPDYVLPRYITGNFNAAGSVRWIDSTTDTNTPIYSATPGSVTPPTQGVNTGLQYAWLWHPYISGDIYFGGHKDGVWNIDYTLSAAGGQDLPAATWTLYRQSSNDLNQIFIATNITFNFKNPAGNVNTEARFDFAPSITSASSKIRIFRSTTSTGAVDFTIYRPGTTESAFRVDAPTKTFFGGNYVSVKNTTNYVVPVDDNGTLYTTDGATTLMAFYLPAPEIGLQYSFYNSTITNTVQVLAHDGGSRILFGGGFGSYGGYLESTNFQDCVTVKAKNTYEWIVLSHEGTGWSVH